LCTRTNLLGEKRRAIHTPQGNANVVPPPDKGNAVVILNANYYKHKVDALLKEPAYRKLAMDPTLTMEQRTMLFIKNFSLTTEVIKQL
jgi:hypothetical protein